MQPCGKRLPYCNHAKKHRFFAQNRLKSFNLFLVFPSTLSTAPRKTKFENFPFNLCTFCQLIFNSGKSAANSALNRARGVFNILYRSYNYYNKIILYSFFDFCSAEIFAFTVWKFIKGGGKLTGAEKSGNKSVNRQHGLRILNTC